MTKAIFKPKNGNEKMSLQEVVSRNIRLFMVVRGVNQRELAEALGVTQPMVSYKLRGSTAWLLGDIEKASELFNVSPEALVAGHGFEPWTSGL